MKYLFVCSGNTCRSPMAEAIMRNFAPETDLVTSAGLFASDSMPRSSNAVSALAELELSIVGDARPLNPGSIEWADMILCMEQHHKEALLRRHAESREKIMTIGEWAGEAESEIEDPFGRSLEAYRHVRDELVRLIRKGLGRANE